MIPKQEKKKSNRVVPNNVFNDVESRKVYFSFESLERNEYFNLDGTCQKWASDLFDTMQKASRITMKEIHAGTYSGKTSPFRIHRHENANPPCDVPKNISLEDLWQIRISLSKGGIHGLFVDNVFYVLWLDPQHNMYPDENHGGLVRIPRLSTCCKERESIIAELSQKLKESQDDVETYIKYIEELEAKNE